MRFGNSYYTHDRWEIDRIPFPGRLTVVGGVAGVAGGRVNAKDFGESYFSENRVARLFQISFY